MVKVDDLAETLRSGFDEPHAEMLARTIVQAVSGIEQDMVRREDFRELTEIVGALAEAQYRTEERVGTLVEAQRRTEERVGTLTERVDALAEAQRRTEECLAILTTRVDTLAEAQHHTEERIGILTEHLDTLTAQVGVLAEAQHHTEERIGILTERLDKTHQMIGGLANRLGYQLENEVLQTLPAILRRDFGIVVEERLVRKYVQYPSGRLDEVNIFGKGQRDGQPISIVGEAKSRLGTKHVDGLVKKAERLRVAGELQAECLLVIVAHSVRPAVEAYAQAQGVKVYWSYEFSSSERTEAG